MMLKGLGALRAFDTWAGETGGKVTPAEAATAAANVRTVHRKAVEEYATDLAALVSWVVHASAGPACRFRAKRLEETLREAIVESAIPPMVEITVPAEEAGPQTVSAGRETASAPVPDPARTDAAPVEGVRILRDSTFPAGTSRSRVISSPDPDEFDFDAWARDEAPLVAAFLSAVESGAAARLLRWLAPRARPPVVAALAQMERQDPRALAGQGSDRLTSSFIRGASADRSPQHFGARIASRLLEALPVQEACELLRTLEAAAPEAHRRMKVHLFFFEDIVFINDRGIQNLLREIENAQLALALKTASEEVKNAFFRNMSKRAGELIREEMAFMGPVRLADVEMAQAGILRAVRLLEEAGEVIVRGRGGEEQIVD